MLVTREQQREYQRKYYGTVHGKAKRKAYAQSEGGKAARRAWLKTPAGRMYAFNRYLVHTYGLTAGQYFDLAYCQEFCCAICGEHESDLDRRGLCVDHNHDTGQVRGLLCNQCNTKIDWSLAYSERVAEYLN